MRKSIPVVTIAMLLFFIDYVDTADPLDFDDC